MDEGADGIQVNVRLSRDGHPVVARDASLDETTDGSGLVRDRTVRELKRLDAGAWFGNPRFCGQRLQTLAEMFERFRERARFWIEISREAADPSELVERVVSAVEIYDVEARATIQSRDPRLLESVRSANPSLPLGLVIDRGSMADLIASPTPASALCLRVDLASAGVVQLMRSAGLASYVWNVDEPAQMDRLIECNPTGIVTGKPGMLRARLTR